MRLTTAPYVGKRLVGTAKAVPFPSVLLPCHIVIGITGTGDLAHPAMLDPCVKIGAVFSNFSGVGRRMGNPCVSSSFRTTQVYRLRCSSIFSALILLVFAAACGGRGRTPIQPPQDNPPPITASPDVRADYVGFAIPNEFVVGYGLDFAERYRNLPFVGVLHPQVYKQSEPKAKGLP